MKDFSPLLKLQGLSFAYAEQMVVKNVSLSLQPNERLGIVGSSGSGKSTLLKLILGQLEAQEGVLELNGVPYKEERNDRLKRHPKVALMHQDFDLDPSITADENIQRKGRHLSDTALKRHLGRSRRVFQMQGFKHQKVSALSGGQKQRVALAAALVHHAEVLLLDEPFSQLDYQLKQEVLNFLEETPLGKGMIIVGHEPSDLMRFCDRILVLDKGRLLQVDSAENIYHFPKNKRVGELTGIINCLSADEQLACGIESSLFRPLHCRLENGGDWRLSALAYHAFGRLGLMEHTSGIKIRAQIPMEGDYPLESSWTVRIKKPRR